MRAAVTDSISSLSVYGHETEMIAASIVHTLLMMTGSHAADMTYSVHCRFQSPAEMYYKSVVSQMGGD